MGLHLRFVIQSMLHRRANVLGALVAQAMAVTIMFATILVLLSTFNGPGVTHRLTAADLVVRVDPAERLGVAADSVPIGLQFRLPATLADDIAQIDGVANVVRDVTFFAQLTDDSGQPVVVSDDARPRGQAWASAALTPFVLQEGAAPVSDTEVVIDRALADAGGYSVGDDVLVATSAAPQRYRISGIATLANATTDALEGLAATFFAPQTADALTDANGEVDLLGVVLHPDADRDGVRRAIDRIVNDDTIDVLHGGARGKADISIRVDDLTELGLVLGVMSGFVGFVAIFVLAGTFSFSIQQRQREIGLQRAVGFTPWQIRRIVIVEAAIIAVLGSIAGVVGGWLLARAFVWEAIREGRAPEGFSVAFHLLALWIVIGASFGIALLAAGSASGRAAKVRPIEALRESSTQRRLLGWRRLLLGLLFMLAGAAAVIVSSVAPAVIAVVMSLATTSALTIGCALLGPLLAVPFVRLLSPLFATRASATGELAVSNTRRFSARVASVASPVLLALGFATLMFCFVETSRVAAVKISDQRMTADLYIVPTSDGLPLAAADAIAALDGVQAVDAQFASVALFSDADDGSFYEVAVIGVDPQVMADTMALRHEAGDLTRFGPGTALLSDFITLDLPIDVGDTVEFQMEDMQPVELRIIGEFSNSLGTADMLIARDDLLPHLRDPLASLLLVNLHDGVDPHLVTERIAQLGQAGYPLQVLTHEAYIAGVDANAADSWATFLIIGGAALFGALAVVNTLAMSTLDRTREFALLRLIGATPGQVLAMLAKEAAMVSVIGVALGWGIGMLSALSVSLGFMGDTSALTVPVLPVLAVGLLAVAIVFTATLIPGTIALRRAPITEIGSRE